MWAEATFFLTVVLVIVLVALLLEMRKRDKTMTHLLELLDIVGSQKQELDARIGELRVDDDWQL